MPTCTRHQTAGVPAQQPAGGVAVWSRLATLSLARARRLRVMEYLYGREMPAGGARYRRQARATSARVQLDAGCARPYAAQRQRCDMEHGAREAAWTQLSRIPFRPQPGAGTGGVRSRVVHGRRTVRLASLALDVHCWLLMHDGEYIQRPYRAPALAPGHSIECFGIMITLSTNTYWPGAHDHTSRVRSGLASSVPIRYR